MHDVVVVGAGPGGSSAAHFLAQHGADVLLLDRFDFPRDKTCGDGLTPRALRVLDEMGILPSVAAQGWRVDGYEVIAPNGRATAAALGTGPGALVVRRRTLDELILRRALASGARFEPRVSVSHLEPTARGVRVHAGRGASFEARTAIVATGAASGVLLRSGVLRRQPPSLLAGRAYFEDVTTRPALQLSFDGVPLPGYGWVFPVGQHAANVGVGFKPGRRRTTRGVFDAFARSRLDGARQCGPLQGYPIRTNFLSSPVVAPHTLLVGEAAGLVNPLTGEGIDYALESGQLAARHILRETPLLEYQRALRGRFEELFRFSALVRDWYCRAPVLNTLVGLANARPALRQMLADILLGEREPAGYGPATILGRLVLYVVRTRRPHAPA